jgi:Fe-Mn family superoxide dismutase
MLSEVPGEAFQLPPLPWAAHALEPVISLRTVQFHHDFHHAGYVAGANQALREYPALIGMSPLQVIRWAAKHAPDSPLFRNAAQAWNHDFYWHSLAVSPSSPGGVLLRALQRDFGGLENFAVAFAEAGMAQFGNGWLWLTANYRRRLVIQTTSNADTPAAKGKQCLLTIDLWEHAYYLDHQNRRREYLDAVIARHLNWGFAAQNFATRR